MPKVNVCKLGPVERPPAASLTHQAEASAKAPEANVKKITQGSNTLKADRPSAAEVALRTQMQTVQQKARKPSTSKHGLSNVRLNGQVQVKPRETSASDLQPVVCRHLALMFAEHPGKKSEMLQAFSTESGIREKFDGKLIETDDYFRKAIRDAPRGCKHLINSDQLGVYLKAIATHLQAPNREEGSPSQANCLLVTTGHAMALHVERKNKNGVDYLSAKLYDPNDTSSYRRVVKPNAEDFGNLKLNDMMIRPELISRLYVGEENKPLHMVAVSLDSRLQPCMDRNATSPCAENMRLALLVGVLDEVRFMLKFALNENKTSKERFELLQANVLDGGMNWPGFYWANQTGHSDVVRVFAHEVLASALLNARAQVDLLLATNGNGTAALCMAFQRSQSGAVQAFTQEVLSSNLSQGDKVDLLVAMTSNGFSGLYIALQQGDSDTVQVFAQEVLSSNLNRRAKGYLLAAKNSDGVAGLCIAFQKGQSGTVQAFTQAVLSSDLRPGDKVNLLNTTSTDGFSGLSRAMYMGFSDTVQVFAQQVLSSDVSEQDKVYLLTAMNTDGSSGLSRALHQGHGYTAEVFENEVLASHLSDAAKIRLLSDIDNFLGLSGFGVPQAGDRA